MALIGERWGVFPRLKQWIKEGRPVWGTCAGMILLSDHALMMKKGGQALVGGLNVEVRVPHSTLTPLALEKGENISMVFND